MVKLSQRLFALDDRVLHVSRKQQELRTPEGWRRNADRWRFFLAFAAVLLVIMAIDSALASASGLWLTPLFGTLCFRAGQLKAEADRLAGRGWFEHNRPASV